MNLENKNTPVKKREIIAWAMYDFANSSYTTVVISFIYSAFFVEYIVPDELSHLKDSLWALSIAISTGLTLFLAPVLGMLCDLTGNKKRYLAWCTWISVLATGGLYFVNPNDIWLGISFLVLSNTAWMLSESFIASFLSDIATKQNMGRISGFGWGIGYVGGLLSLVLMTLIITAEPEINLDLYVSQNQMAMLVVALFYAMAAWPTFVFVKQRTPAKVQKGQLPPFKGLLKDAITQAFSINVLLRNHPVLFKFFLAFLFYMAGVAVVIKFFGIYAQQEIGIKGTQLLIIGATLQIAAMVGAIAFGFLEDKVGAKKSLFLSISWWLAGITGIYFLEPLANLSNMSMSQLFVVIAFIAGAAMGATQSASRSVVGLLAKPEDSALLFGLWGTAARLAIILGMSFGLVSDLTSRQDALLIIMAYFVIGALLLIRVPLNSIKSKGETQKN